MAKIRIKYEVDDKQVEEANKELKKTKELTKDVEEGFDDANKGIKKTGGSLSDLKSTVAGLGLAAAAGAAVVEFAKLTQEVNKNRKEVAQLTNETGKALDKITAKLRATSGVFEKDFNEVLRAANTISKEFGVSMTDAIDGINEGFVRGLDINGEYLHTLREYSTFIKEAGLNQEQFNVLIQKQVTQGIYSDKGIDAIKEAVLSIREMTPVTKEAIKNIGIDTDKMIKDIQSGTTTYFEAVQQIATRTQEIADPTKTGAILADVFKGAGEDAGNFIFTLGDVQQGYADVSEEQQKYIDKQNALLESSEDVNEELVKFSTNFKSATTNIAIFANIISTQTLKALNALLGTFISIEASLDNFDKGIKTLELEQLNKELAELEKGPSFIERLAAAAGGLFGQAKQATEYGLKVGIIKDRIKELTEAEKEGNEETEKEITLRKTIAPILDEEAQKRERLKQINEDLAQIKRDVRLQEMADKRAFDEEFADNEIEQAEDLNAQLAEINKMRLEKELEDEEDFQGRKMEIIMGAVDTFTDILSSFNQLRIQQIDQEVQANELARNRELEAAEGNAVREFEINEKFDKKKEELRVKQVKAQKQQSLIEIGIATAKGIALAVAESPLTFGLPFSAFVAATGIAQALVVSKFKKGVIDLQGPGTETSDSIPAMLSKRESVMTANETKDYKDTLLAIRRREIRPEVLNSFVLNGANDPIIINDYNKLAEAVMRQPQNHTMIDENGFTGFMYRGVNSRQIKQSKFRM
jgi:hypothetical protein